MGIVLRALRLSPEEAEIALMEVDDERLDASTLEALISIAPTAEEREAVRTFTQDSSSEEVTELSPPARLCLVAERVPRLGPRLQCLLLRCRFDEFVDDTRREIQLLQEAVRQVRGCAALPQVLRYVLTMGNVLNKGADKISGATGFKIADLAKLKSLKSIEGNASLLDYLVDFILVQNPQYAAFTEDLGIVHQAKGTAKQDITSNVAAIMKDMKILQSQLNIADREKASRPDDKFFQKLQPFHTKAEEDLSALKDEMDEMSNALDALGEFFGEGKGAFNSQQFFAHLSSFCNDFDAAAKKKASERKAPSSPSPPPGPAGLQVPRPDAVPEMIVNAQARFAQQGHKESDTVWR